MDKKKAFSESLLPETWQKQKGPATLMGRPIIKMGGMIKFLGTALAEERVREICREMIQEALQESEIDKIKQDPLFKRIMADIKRRREASRKKKDGLISQIKLQIILPDLTKYEKQFIDFHKTAREQLLKNYEIRRKK